VSVAAAVVAAGTFVACLLPAACSDLGTLDAPPPPDVVTWHLSTCRDVDY
jgi:hypothetical protein